MKRQQGFTLVELMISSVIGLIILTGMMNLFITINKNVTLSDALSQNQETGRFAMEYLTKNIRRAGYTEDPTVNLPAILMATNNFPCVSIPESEACSANNPDGVRGDRLAIPFYIAPGDEVRTCTGIILGDEATDPTEAANVFWVSDDTDTDRELLCRTYDLSSNPGIWLDAAPVSIITNVEAFEFQIGVAETRGDKGAASYVSVDHFVDVERIRSIRISLLTTSQESTDEDKTSTNNTTRTYSLMDAPYREITDANLRTLFSNTIELPNKLEQVDLSDF